MSVSSATMTVIFEKKTEYAKLSPMALSIPFKEIINSSPFYASDTSTRDIFQLPFTYVSGPSKKEKIYETS